METSSNVQQSDLFSPRPLREALRDFKREYVEKVMQEAGGVQRRAAKILNIQPTYLCRLIKELRRGTEGPDSLRLD